MRRHPLIKRVIGDPAHFTSLESTRLLLRDFSSNCRVPMPGLLGGGDDA